MCTSCNNYIWFNFYVVCKTSKEINKHEYFQIKSQEEDIEDIEPIISEPSETLPMSREELTAKIAELEAANKALFDLIESLQQKEK